MQTPGATLQSAHDLALTLSPLVDGRRMPVAAEAFQQAKVFTRSRMLEPARSIQVT